MTGAIHFSRRSLAPIKVLYGFAAVGADRSLEIPFTLGAGRRRTLLLDPSVDLDLEAALPVENPPRMPSSNFLEDVADGYNTYPLYSWSGDRVLHTLERPPPLLPTPHSDHSYGRSDTSQRPSEEQRTSRSYGARLRSAGKHDAGPKYRN